MFIITKIITQFKCQLRDHFGFSKSETNGVIVLLGIVLFLLAIPYSINFYYKKIYHENYATDIALLNNTLETLQKQYASTEKQLFKQSESSKNIQTPQKKSSSIVKIIALDINTITSQQLESLAGIGPKRSSTIIKYRDKLGGFIQKQQYQEIYGLDSLSLNSLVNSTYIRADFAPKKLNINLDNFKTLLAHPYLAYEKVQSILRFRNKQGRFRRIEELLQLNIVEQTTFEKIKPYLTV